MSPSTPRLEADGPLPEDPFEAAAWWHELFAEGDTDRQTESAHIAWLEASPKHREAWQLVNQSWDQSALAANTPPILAQRALALAPYRKKPHTGRFVAGLFMAFGLMAILTLGWQTIIQHEPDLDQAATIETAMEYATAIGQRSSLILEDGSKVELNTASRLTVRLTETQRIIHLTQGQALFHVASDPQRPFVVEAGSHRITALGTVFDVRVMQDEPSVQVTMVEGLTRVEKSDTIPRAPRAPDPALVLTAGEQLLAGSASAAERRLVDASRVTSWQQGRLVFDNERLVDAVAEINRYLRRIIVLDDPNLTELRISGTFSAGHAEPFVEALEGIHNVQVVQRSADRIVLASVD